MIEAQDPPEIPAPADGSSVLADKVSNTYRRWLKELSNAAAEGPQALKDNLASIRLETDTEYTDIELS